MPSRSTAQPLEITGQRLQVFACNPKQDRPQEFEWFFKGSEAALFDTDGNKGSRVDDVATCLFYAGKP